MSEDEPHVCEWPGTPRDTWRCPSHMFQMRNGKQVGHDCAASEGHPGDHCCIHGTRWINLDERKPRRRWRDLIRRRQR